MVQRIYTGEATPMDLDIMASVQEQIIGNCLCVLGDAMAMPIGSMVAKFRAELEAEIEAARANADGAALEDVVALGVADEHAGPIPVH
jgi:NADH-quinone oxidoreductase subunit F